MLLSVVVPCYNEEESVAEAHRRLGAVLRDVGMDVELVFVDDGSRDATVEILREIARTDPRVRIVQLARNFGHQIAVTAGIDHAAGDAVVLIDADLQDPPEVILEMLGRWREGYQVAYGVRAARPPRSTA
jgi:polyisoprenyl-phosphate glycosyltransferase